MVNHADVPESGNASFNRKGFRVDLDAVRQNLVDVVKYKFSDPLSSIRVSGGAKFHTVHVNDGKIELRGIDRPVVS